MGCIDNVSIPGEMDAAGAPAIAWNCMSQVLRQVSHARRVSRVDHAKRVAALEQVCVACPVADFVDVKMTDFALKPLHQHERAFVPPRQERTRCGRRAGTDGQCADTQRDAAQLEHAIDLSRDGPFCAQALKILSSCRASIPGVSRAVTEPLACPLGKSRPRRRSRRCMSSRRERRRSLA